MSLYGRQYPLIFGAITLLTALSACAPGTPPNSAGQAAQSAATAAPAVGKTAVAAIQTAEPQVRATAGVLAPTVQAAASAVAASDQFQTALAQAERALASVRFQTTVTPAGSSGAQVTRAEVKGTDPTGTFAALDSAARRAAVTASLNLASQMYPSARVELTILGTDSKTLGAGTKDAGAQPVVTEPAQ